MRGAREDVVVNGVCVGGWGGGGMRGRGPWVNGVSVGKEGVVGCTGEGFLRESTPSVGTSPLCRIVDVIARTRQQPWRCQGFYECHLSRRSRLYSPEYSTSVDLLAPSQTPLRSTSLSYPCRHQVLGCRLDLPSLLQSRRLPLYRSLSVLVPP